MIWKVISSHIIWILTDDKQMWPCWSDKNVFICSTAQEGMQHFCVKMGIKL